MNPQPKMATFIKDLGPAQHWSKKARLYKLSEPAQVREFGQEKPLPTSPWTDYVVVSSTPGSWKVSAETKLFRSDENGLTPFFWMLTQAVVPGEGQFEAALQAFGYQLKPLPTVNGTE